MQPQWTYRLRVDGLKFSISHTIGQFSTVKKKSLPHDSFGLLEKIIILCNDLLSILLHGYALTLAPNPSPWPPQCQNMVEYYISDDTCFINTCIGNSIRRRFAHGRESLSLKSEPFSIDGRQKSTCKQNDGSCKNIQDKTVLARFFFFQFCLKKKICGK